MKNLLQALANMHAEFGVTIKDDSTGARNVSYASLAHTLDTIAKMTKPHGLQLTQDYELFEGMPMIVSTLTHIATGESKVSKSILTPKKDGDPCQAWGGATTYHKRYGAMTVCGIFCHGDASDDDGQVKKTEDMEEKSDAISDKQLGLLRQKLKGNPDKEAQLIKKYGSLAQIPWKAFQEILKWVSE